MIYPGAMLLLLAALSWQARAQGVKSANQFSSSSSSSSTSSSPQQPSQGSQLSSTFMQTFNSLTPLQQQQFIRQMSASNRRILQQALLQPQTSAASSFTEESSSSGGSLPILTNLGTKSAKSFSSSSQSGSLSPIQQAFLRQQQQQVKQQQIGSLQPQTQFSSSFSRQSSASAQQQPSQQLANEFQSTKTSSAGPGAQQSFFNRVQEVKQVAQPVVLPSSEQSFRRVQSFSSQPLVSSPESAGLSSMQQFFQQQLQQPQPIQSAFSRFQSSQFSQANQQPQPLNFNQFSSSFSGSDLGLNGGLAGFGGLQQEKVETNSNLVDAGSLGQQQQQSSFGAFESSDVQQKNLLGGGQQNLVGNGEDFTGLAAASINNKWYIMKPIDNPTVFGLPIMAPPGADAISASLRSTSANLLPLKSPPPPPQPASPQSSPTPSTSNPKADASTRDQKKRSSGDKAVATAAIAPKATLGKEEDEAGADETSEEEEEQVRR